MNSLYGLVVCGGKSSRMGTDKSLIQYRDKPQRYRLYEMMLPLCGRVFISCNKYQQPDIPSEYQVLVDEPEYEGIGPMAALLTAFKHYPAVDFMMVGCDYPLIDQHHLELLSNVKLDTFIAGSYYNKGHELYEPLLAVYSSVILPELENQFKTRQYSLQKILRKINADRIIPENIRILKSIDTIDEYKNF